jgi:hypothetical protein
MILPQAVGKSAGLCYALFSLRVSIHNAVGIGDARTITTCSMLGGRRRCGVGQPGVKSSRGRGD